MEKGSSWVIQEGSGWGGDEPGEGWGRSQWQPILLFSFLGLDAPTPFLGLTALLSLPLLLVPLPIKIRE